MPPLNTPSESANLNEGQTILRIKNFYFHNFFFFFRQIFIVQLKICLRFSKAIFATPFYLSIKIITSSVNEYYQMKVLLGLQFDL